MTICILKHIFGHLDSPSGKILLVLPLFYSYGKGMGPSAEKASISDVAKLLVRSRSDPCSPSDHYMLQDHMETMGQCSSAYTKCHARVS